MEFLEYRFIEPELEIDTKKRQPASYLRRRFRVSKKIVKAQMSTTALGCYIGYLNGVRVDEQLLLPGYTDYNYRVQSNTYDVTRLINIGENMIGAIVGDGWYRGALGIRSVRNGYGDKIKFACVLMLMYEDGSTQNIYSDSSWEATQEGALRENDLKVVEHFDAKRDWEMRGWNEPKGECVPDTAIWHEVLETSCALTVIPQQGERIVEHEVFVPTVLHTPDGNVVLDFKQNLSGHVEFTVCGKSGQSVELTMGEVLDEKGNFTQKNLVAEGAGSVNGELGQKLIYDLRDGKQTYKSKFLISGYRYVLLSQWPENVEAKNFKSIAVYSDIPMAGEFECSNTLINQMVKNVRWSMKSNFIDIPTDCPTRERSGWTADISVFSESACFLSDPRKFLKKWLADFILEQGQDGSLPFVVPQVGYRRMQRSCKGWSDALANVAMTLYRFYGEEEVIHLVYDAIKRYVDFDRKRAHRKNKLLFYKKGKHRKYIIETGFHYGEWLEPGSVMAKDFLKDLFIPDTEVTTAWFYQTANQLAQMAGVLGKEADRKEYQELATQIRRAYQKEFLQKEQIRFKRQCRLVRPLAMKIVSDEQMEQMARALNEMCIANNYKIGTGFLTTYQILPVLAENGFADTAYKMLENMDMPGWLYPLTKGATTTWENWYGIDEYNIPRDSHNHYATGSVVQWLFSYCAGITPTKPGFDEIQIRPTPGGSLSYAKARYHSIKGDIISEWEIIENDFFLYVETPEGVVCRIVMPDGQEHKYLGGKKKLHAKLL